MSQDESSVYSKCINCGRYAPEANMLLKHFCSEDCARQYRRCIHCGNYFMLTDDPEQRFCSTACEGADRKHYTGEDQ